MNSEQSRLLTIEIEDKIIFPLCVYIQTTKVVGPTHFEDWRLSNINIATLKGIAKEVSFQIVGIMKDAMKEEKK